MAQRPRALFVRREQQPLHVLFDAVRRDLVDAADQGQHGGNGVVELALRVGDDGVVEDVDEVLCVALCVDFGKHGVHAQELELLALLVLEIQVDERVDEVVDRRLQGRVGDLAPVQDLEDVRYRFGEVLREVGVEVGDVEEQLEGFGQRHQVHGRSVHLRGAAGRFGVSFRVASHGEVDVFGELVRVHESIVVGVCIVGHEEEKAGKKEFIIDVLALSCKVRRMACSMGSR